MIAYVLLAALVAAAGIGIIFARRNGWKARAGRAQRRDRKRYDVETRDN